MDPNEQKDERPATPSLGDVFVQKLIQLVPLIQEVVAQIPSLGGGFIGFILNSPKMIIVAWEMYRFVDDAKGDIGRVERIKYLQAAIYSARVDKDPTKLTELFNGRTFPPTPKS